MRLVTVRAARLASWEPNFGNLATLKTHWLRAIEVGSKPEIWLLLATFEYFRSPYLLKCLNLKFEGIKGPIFPPAARSCLCNVLMRSIKSKYPIINGHFQNMNHIIPNRLPEENWLLFGYFHFLPIGSRLASDGPMIWLLLDLKAWQPCSVVTFVNTSAISPR